MPATQDSCPYVGLQPYTDDDRDYFFGRERDQRVITSNMYAASLTILYGESGVGKSSVLLAGVLPYLRNQQRSAVVVFREWQRPDFLDAIKAASLTAIEVALGKPGGIAATLPLDALLCAGAEAIGGPILLLFDQFEEYFLYHPGTGASVAFDTEFARAVNREAVDAGFLIAIREDALSKLDRFRARIPNLLGNTLRLQHLSAAEAEAAIRKPLDVFNARQADAASPVVIEDDLVRAVLSQVRTGQVSIAQSAGMGQAQAGEDTSRIEAPFLQLVITRLWEEERTAGSRVLRASTLQRLGGAQDIVASHLGSVMAGLEPVDQEVCSRFFDRLVTPSGSKIACGADDLTEWAGDLAAHVPPVLQTLSDRRLLRGVAGPADRPQMQRFEIFHDVLAPAVLAWRTHYIEVRERAEAERRAEEQRKRADEQASAAKRLRTLSWALSAVVVLAIGAASYAWRQRGEAERQKEQAETQTHLATARYLVGETRLHLRDQLDLALLLGLEARQQADTDEVRSGLADALLANPLLGSHFHGNREFVSVAFSPDGKTLVAGGGDLQAGRLFLWDTKSHRPLGLPLAHPFSVLAVAVSPDGTTMVSGSCGKVEDALCQVGEIGIWDMASRKPVGQKLKGHTNFVRSLAFSPDGRILASASLDGTVMLWDVPSWQPLAPPLTGHVGWITDLAFSPDGKTLASAGCGRSGGSFADCTQGEIRLWNVIAREPLGDPLRVHSNYVLSVAFSPDGRMLASSGLDGALILSDSATGKALGAPLRGHAGVRGGVAFSPDGTTLASGSVDNTILLWDVVTRQPLGPPLTGHTSLVHKLAFSPDGNTLASASSDGSDILWELGARLRGHTVRITAAGFSPDGRTVVGIGEDNTVSLWNAATHRSLGPALAGHEAKIKMWQFSPDSKVLATASEDGTLILWDVATRLPLGQPLSHNSAKIDGLDFSPDSKVLVTSADDATIVLWDVASGQRIGQPFQSHRSSTVELDFTPDGKKLLWAGFDGALILWDAATHERLASFVHGGPAALFGARLSPDGGKLASYKADGTLVLWDVLTGRKLEPDFTGDGAAISSVAFAADGRTVTSVDLLGTVVVWDLATHRPSGRRLATPTGATRVTDSPNGKVLAVFGMDGKITFWDTATRNQLGSAIGGDNGAALSKGFETVASIGNNDIVLQDVRFLTDATTWQARACDRANRNLTRAEWQRYLGEEPYHATCPGLPLDDDAAANPETRP